MIRQIFAYVAMLAVFLAIIGVLLHFGSQLESPPGPALGPAATSGTDPLDALGANLNDPVAHLLLQAVVIIAAARIVGGLARRLGQPAVIGEILAGIVLGPSLLGLVAPRLESFLFPAASLGTLNLLSQIGVVLFMFVVGISLDGGSIRRQARSGIMISHASILLPFILGGSLSLFLYPTQAGHHTPFSTFCLFLGVSMSITAFPVLARILQDRGLSGTEVGSTAIACAAVDDASAWCILAIVIGMARSGGLASAVPTIALTAVFAIFMLLLVKPPLARLVASRSWVGSDGRAVLAVALIFLFTCAFITQAIGIHPLFGAFLAGAIIPPNPELRTLLRERLEAFSSAFLLPMFFAITGLRTQLGLLASWQDWLLCAALILVAIAGKGVGSMLAARWTGMSWIDAATIGTLMNSRGLVELVALNIGYDLGILSTRLFTMLVLMALVTTFITGPALSWIERGRSRSALRPATSEPVSEPPA